MKEYIEVLKKYAVFEGRATRKEYWMFFLYNFLIALILGFILGIFRQPSLMFLVWIYDLAVLIPGIAVAIRRLHDTNHSGWWVLIGLIPIIGQIWILILLVSDSTPGDNKYGPNPKGMQGTAMQQPQNPM
jgi:uncharacterized membrane protein YhaH (DUF805 family)